MKKLLIILMVLILCAGLFGCVETDSGNTQSNTLETQSIPVTEATQSTQAPLATEITEVTEATAGATEATEITEVTEATESVAETTPIHTHSWTDATCTQPKTCVTCGETTGSAAGHSYTGGTCSVCGKEAPTAPQEPIVWIPTNGGTKYHAHSGCSNMIDPIGVSKSYALSQGFTACKKCY